MIRKRAAHILPWLLVVTLVTSLIARETWWRGVIGKTGKLEAMLGEISRAPKGEQERAAFSKLADWLGLKKVMVSLTAYDRQTGQMIPMAYACAEGGKSIAFEIGFDTDGDHLPDRHYQLYPKDREGVLLLMRQ